MKRFLENCSGGNQSNCHGDQRYIGRVSIAVPEIATNQSSLSSAAWQNARQLAGKMMR